MSESIRSLLTSRLHAVATVCIALMLSLPFLFPVNGFPVPTYYQEWTAFALGCTALVALAFAQSNTGIEIPRIVVLPLGILVLLLTQMALGSMNYWQQGAIGAIYLIWSAAMMGVGRALRNRLGWNGFCTLSAWVVIVGASLSAVIGILQLTGMNAGGLVTPMVGPAVRGNLGQANHFASYLCMGVLATIYLASTRRLNPFLAGGALLLLLTLASLTGSRSVWLYLAAASGLAMWAFHGARSSQTTLLVIWAVAAIVTLSIVKLISGIYTDGVTFLQPLGVAGLSVSDEPQSHRLVIWSAALLMIKSAPLAGIGFYGFAWNYFLFAGPLPAGIPEEITGNAHNLVLHVFAEFGLPGGILLIGAACLWWFPQFREKASINRWWVLSIVAVVSVHSLLEYPLWYAYFLGLFAVFAGAGDTAFRHIGSVAKSRIVVAALCVGIAWTLVSLFDDYRRVERVGLASATNREQTDVLGDAVNIARSTLFPDIVELGLSRTIRIDRNELDSKLELNGRVLRSNPASDVAYRQSALLALADDLPAAYRLWDLAVAAYPSQAGKVAQALASRSSMGEARLAALVEYAASRTKE